MVAPGADQTITASNLHATNISFVQETTQYFSIFNEGINLLPGQLVALVKQAVQDAIERPTSNAEPLSSTTKNLSDETEANSAEAFISATQDADFGLYPLS
ncbi:MAG TPA: hypothetical protein VGQ99_18345, partial [Tepidisphaeraceae bacterium]|nr:hypothetical protein [Tepidisphaeraceae bacterium]